MVERWRNKFLLEDKNTWVFEPSERYVSLGKMHKSAIEERWSPPINYFHLQAGGHVAALKYHINNQYFAGADIQGFFEKINRSKITRSIKNILGYSHARRIAIDSTVRHPETGRYILPFGFVQSPIIASVCLRFSALGNMAAKFQANRNLKIAIYVDDFVISSNDESLLNNVLDSLICAAERSGFPFSPGKVARPSKSLTAFNIVLSNQNLEICAPRLDLFRDAYQSGNSSQKYGIRSYVNSVNSAQSSSL